MLKTLSSNDIIFYNGLRKFIATPTPAFRALPCMVSHALRKKNCDTIIINYRANCNFSCKHCYTKDLLLPENSLITLDDIRQLSKDAHRIGTLCFEIQGGEPLLLPELPDLIQALRPSLYCISVVTNGFLLTPQLIKKLKKAGLRRLSISIDSIIDAEHDSFRNQPGSLKKCLEGINYTIQAGIVPSIFTTVWKGRTKEKGFVDLVEFAHKRKIQLQAIIASPTGRWKGNLNILASDDDLKELERLHKDYHFVYRDLFSNFFHKGCKCLVHPCIISSGDVLPCPLIHISLGNIRFESIKKIIKRGFSIPWFYPSAKICLAGEHGPFMDKIMPKLFSARTLPLMAEDIFDLSHDLPIRK